MNKMKRVYSTAVKMVNTITRFDLIVKVGGKLADPNTKPVFQVAMTRITKLDQIIVHGVFDMDLKVIRDKSGWPVEAANIADVTKLVDVEIGKFLLKGEAEED